MADTVIKIDQLSKYYRLGVIGARTLSADVSQRWAKLTGKPDPFLKIGQQSRNKGAGRNGNSGDGLWALDDISLQVKRGDVLGIIGRNGAGKSTLLKILSRVTAPTAGEVRVKGRIASLLEVGTGFHPELTGRENVFLNGAILGMTRSEIRQRFDEIVAFSEVEKHIDTPVKRYSSGMYVRLAFAVAAHLEPEILIVDEVLAVGDAGFQKKCLGKMGDIGEEGRTVLFVSHNLAALEHLCHTGIALQDGKLAFGGTAKEAVDYYLHSIDGREASKSHVTDLTESHGRRVNKRKLLQRLELFTDGGKPVKGSLKMGASLTAHIYFKLEKATSTVEANLAFDNMLGQRVFSAHSAYQPNRPEGRWVGDQEFVCEIPSLTLIPGEYKIKIALDVDNSSADTIEDALRLEIIESDYYGTGRLARTGMFVLQHNWHLTSQSQIESHSSRDSHRSKSA